MRETATYVKCDGDGCATMAKVARDTETPDGWIRISEYHEGQAGANFDLCSLRCVERWARGRRLFLAGMGDRGKEQAITDLFRSDPDAVLTVNDVAELVSCSDTLARSLLKSLTERDVLQCIEEGRRGRAGRYQLGQEVRV